MKDIPGISPWQPYYKLLNFQDKFNVFQHYDCRGKQHLINHHSDVYRKSHLVRTKTAFWFFAREEFLARTRHLMKDFKDLMPHTRSESKFEKSCKLTDINEMAELANCTRCMYFENRKKRDSYLWLADVNGGASVKFLILNIHTMQELKMTGNCLKGSRPILSFDPQFDSTPHLQLVKEMFKHVSPFHLFTPTTF